MSRPRYACGLELSSQSATWGFLDLDGGQFHPGSFTYDSEFKGRYPIEGGVIRGDGGEVHVPQLMLLEAMDKIFEKAPKELLKDTVVYKADCMQHAQTFTRDLGKGLRAMDPNETIAANLGDYLTRGTVPIWEDRSTKLEAAYLDDKLAPHGGMIALTGNPTELRFPAAQLLRWKGQNYPDFLKTSEIRALSAGVTSVLCGHVADTDTGDGWGTNLNTMNIDNPGHSQVIADLIDPRLLSMLGGMAHYDKRAGRISQYFVERHGAYPSALVLSGTCDNPAYLLNFFLSAGTSWTLNGQLPEVTRSNGEDNVFGCKPGRVMSLVCFTNGGRLHEEFCKRYAEGSWERYHELAGQAQPASHLMLPYMYDESVPRRKAGIVRDGFDESDASANIRALYDSMILSSRAHSKHMKIPGKIWVLAGGGKSHVLTQGVADAFDRETGTLAQYKHAAVFGNAMAGAADVLGISYEQAIRTFARELSGSNRKPIPDNVRLYRDALPRFEELERRNAT